MKLTNTYRKALVVFSVIGLPILFSNLSGTKYIIKSTGSHPGSTGAPGDVTCKHSGCHADATVANPATGVNQFNYPVADSTYTPGQTYNISLKVTKSGISRFGFELCALENATNTSAGTLTITDANRTQLLNHTVSGNTRYSITHMLAGTPATPSTGQTTWAFSWKAPLTNIGNVTFYYCTNCTNNNSANSGDALYLNSFTVKPANNIGIAEYMDEQGANIYFDQISRQVILNYTLKQNNQVAVKITDALGRDITRQTAESKSAGNNMDRIALDNIADGVYIVNLCVGDRVMSKKIMIR